MTEKEWLELSDVKKNGWILWHVKEYLPKPCEDVPQYLNWQGFGMIVEKDEGKRANFWKKGKDWRVSFYRGNKYCWSAIAPTPWEAAALSYGKMRGLIE